MSRLFVIISIFLLNSCGYGQYPRLRFNERGKVINAYQYYSWFTDSIPMSIGVKNSDTSFHLHFRVGRTDQINRVTVMSDGVKIAAKIDTSGKLIVYDSLATIKVLLKQLSIDIK